MSRLEKIQAYGAAQEASKMAAIERERDERRVLEDKIRDLAPRIDELLSTARDCVENGIHLGAIGTGTFSSKPAFATDGIVHNFGFVLDRPFYPSFYHNPSPAQGGIPTKIGYAGGGVDGDDFYVDKFGAIVSGSRKPNFKKMCMSFLMAFPKFEHDFYEYVDKLTANV